MWRVLVKTKHNSTYDLYFKCRYPITDAYVGGQEDSVNSAPKQQQAAVSILRLNKHTMSCSYDNNAYQL